MLGLVIASQGKVEAFEVELPRRYMTERNGRIIVLIDPGRSHGLEELLLIGVSYLKINS